MEFRWLLQTISGCLKRRAPASSLLGRWCGSGDGDEMRSKDACSNRQNCANPADVLGGGKTLHDLGIGFKPVTSSLGIHPYIESKSLARFCCDFLNLQRLAESAFCHFVPAIEA
jgi:hypothetical protein